MKKMKFLLPLLALIVTGCKTNPSSSDTTPPVDSSSSIPSSSDPASSDPSTTLPPSTSETPSTSEAPSTSETSSTSETPNTKSEINGNLIDQIVGESIYAKMPKIFSNDYEVIDESNDAYPVDIYVDVFDWSIDDAIAYDDLLQDYPLTEDGISIISGDIYAVVYEDDETYDELVYGVNIFTEAEGTIDPGDKKEIDGSLIDAFFDTPVYSLMPKIYSNDYDVFDNSSEDYPIDLYVDLFDWSDDDADAYDELLQGFPLTADGISIIREGVYAFVYLEDEFYDEPVYGVNIFTEAGEGPTNPVEPGEKKEIDGSLIDAFFDAPVYSLMPQIYSNDYDVFDNSSEDYPIDLYVDLFDWSDDDADAYDDLLQNFPLTEDGISIIREGVYAYVYLEDEFYDEPVYGVNIFTEAGEGPTEPVEPVEPVEPGVLLTTTISSKYTSHYATDVTGNINSHLTIANGAPINVAVESNSAQNKNIFNNAAGEIRLYLGAGNGSELIFTGAQEGLVFVSITVNTSQNDGYSINGEAMITTSGVKTSLNNATSISLQNVGTVSKAQVRITSIVIEYIVLEA